MVLNVPRGRVEDLPDALQVRVPVPRARRRIGVAGVCATPGVGVSVQITARPNTNPRNGEAFTSGGRYSPGCTGHHVEELLIVLLADDEGIRSPVLRAASLSSFT